MRQLHYLLLLLASFVFITACSDDDFYANPLLKVSKTSLEFDKTATQASVEVTKNKNDEFYTMLDGDQGAGWLKVVPTDSGFNVVVEENTSTKDRIATITLVLKKGTLPAPVTVRVKQSKVEDVSLTLSEEEVSFPSHGGEVLVYLMGNFNKTSWAVNSDVDWIILDVAGLDYKFTLKALDNPTTAERTAKITVTTEQGATASIDIYQGPSITWDLPYLDMGYDLETRRYKYPYNLTNVARFEEARGSTYLRGGFGVLFEWKTKSKFIPRYQYFVPIGTTTLNQIIAYPDPATFDFMEDPLYWEYLESEGFKLTYADDYTVYDDRRFVFWNKEREIAIIHRYSYSPEIWYMWYRDEPHHHASGQMRPCTSFESFPTYFFDPLATLSDVDTWEGGQNSKQLERGPNAYTFTPDPSKSKEMLLERVYIINSEGKLKETWLLFEDLELVFFQCGTVNTYYATDEFKAFMEAQGFVLEAEDPYSGILYTHAEKDLDVYASIRNYESEDMLPRLVIQIAPLGLGGGV